MDETKQIDVILPKPCPPAGFAFECDHQRICDLRRGGGGVVTMAWCQDCGALRISDSKLVAKIKPAPPITTMVSELDPYLWLYPVRDGWPKELVDAIIQGKVEGASLEMLNGLFKDTTAKLVDRG